MSTQPNLGRVYQRARDGRWVAALSIGGGKRVIRYGRTEREAQAALQALVVEQHATLPHTAGAVIDVLAAAAGILRLRPGLSRGPVTRCARCMKYAARQLPIRFLPGQAWR
jgi:hypothetical protein